jgi:HPt (histidine-containing phosphotransfer) domain-containing protein
MSTENGPIDFQIIRDMLYNDDAYVKEFCDASVISFSEFKSNFRNNLLNEDLGTLRQTGHKIKPVAKMLKLDPILNIYEKSKLLLMEGGEPGQKEQYVKEMDEYCEKILDQLHQRVKK